LTDAPCDEIDVFEVDVVQITLVKFNGAVVTTLPATQRVNFADLTDMSEILVGTSIPAGFYKRASIALDFSNALVLLNGSTTPAAVVDEDGNPITGIVNTSLEFGTSARPYVSQTRSCLFVFDLDLNNSVTVDLTGNSVTFTPVISCTVDPSDPNPIISTGRLVSVDTETGDISLGIRNFITGNLLCRYTVHTEGDTVFHVNGSALTGSAGLEAVAALSEGTRVFAHGVVDTSRAALEADFVVAGMYVPGGDMDCVEGLVVSRDVGAGADPTLTVLGRCYDHTAQAWTFNQTFTVSASFADTTVLRWRSGDTALSTDNLNVGQRIRAFGVLSGTSLDASGVSQGVIRTLKTDIFGFAAGPVSGGTLTVDVRRIGLRPIANFDFVVESVSVADPAAFLVDAGSLSAGTVTTGTPVRVRGYMAPLTALSAEPDFSALTIIDRSDVASLLVVRYVPADPAAFTSISSESLSIDVSGATFAGVDQGFVGVIDLTASPEPTITPKFAIGLYHIIQDGTLTGFLSFENFSAALAERTAAGARVARIAALGGYDAGTQVLSASIVSVSLK